MSILTAPERTKVASPAKAEPLSAAEHDTLVTTAAQLDEKAQVGVAGAPSGDARGWTATPEKLSDRVRTSVSQTAENLRAIGD
jgi:hypothetical protein